MTLNASEEAIPTLEEGIPPLSPNEAGTETDSAGKPPDVSHKNLASALFLIGQPLLLNAISLPATAFIIRQLGALHYGEWAVASSLVAAVSCMASLGLRSLFIRSVSRDPSRAREALGEQLGLRGALALLAGVLVILVAVLLRYTPLVISCVAVASVSLLFTSLSSVFGDIMQGFQRFREFAFVNLIAGIGLTVASVLAVLWGKGPLGLAVAYLIGPLLSFFLFYFLVRKILFKPTVVWSIPRYKALLYDVRMLGSQQVLNSVQSRAEQLLVPKLVGYVAMGYFSAGLMIASRLEMVPDGISTAFFPLIAKNSKDNARSAARYVSYLMMVSLVVCVPLALLAVYIASPLATFFFKTNPEVCKKVMWITVWSLPLQAVSLPMNYALQACGKHSEAARRGMWSTLFSSIASIALISRFGLIGACLSWLARLVITIAFLSREFHREFPTTFTHLPLGRILLSAGAMGGMLWLSLKVAGPKFLVLGMGSLTGVLIYGAALVLLRVISASDLRQMLSRPKAAVSA